MAIFSEGNDRFSLSAILNQHVSVLDYRLSLAGIAAAARLPSVLLWV